MSLSKETQVARWAERRRFAMHESLELFITIASSPELPQVLRQAASKMVITLRVALLEFKINEEV